MSAETFELTELHLRLARRYEALIHALSPDGMCAIGIFTQGTPTGDEWTRTGNELFGRPIMIQRQDRTDT